MNTIQAIKTLLEAVVHIPDSITAYDDAISILADLTHAYDAFAPRPEDWPDWANHCITQPNGDQYFYEDAPVLRLNANRWWTSDKCRYNAYYRTVAIEHGIDWRECHWEKGQPS